MDRPRRWTAKSAEFICIELKGRKCDCILIRNGFVSTHAVDYAWSKTRLVSMNENQEKK